MVSGTRLSINLRSTTDKPQSGLHLTSRGSGIKTKSQGADKKKSWLKSGIRILVRHDSDDGESVARDKFDVEQNVENDFFNSTDGEIISTDILSYAKEKGTQ